MLPRLLAGSRPEAGFQAHRRFPVLVLLAGLALFTNGVAAQEAAEEAGASRAAGEVYFAHGMLAFQQGKYQDAAQLFAEAVRNDPHNGTARHWLGLSYLGAGRAGEAVAALEASLGAARPPEAGRRRVRQDLERARLAATGEGKGTIPAVSPPEHRLEPALEELPRWDGWIGLEAGYDSNPGLVAEELTSSPFRSVVPDAASDSAGGIDLRFEHHPFYGRRGWSLGLALAGRQSMYQELDELDLSLVEGMISLVKGEDLRGLATGPLGSTRVPLGLGRFSAMLQAGGGYARLGGESFLRLAEAAASVKVRESSRAATRFDVEARERTFLQDDRRGSLLRSGEEAALGVHQYVSLGRGDRYLRMGLVAGRRWAEGLAFDADFGETSAEVGLPLAHQWTLFLLASYREDRFAQPESNLADPGGAEREDTTWRATAALLWRTTDRLFWTLSGGYVRRDSNLALFSGASLLDYDRATAVVRLQWLF
ncbi:MAG TPA: tetratricopeptide repeat protein [Thermoanaerobaculia bacterium]|nr:tetratricopeptide repeat protein [Thermoanaerobaculia bacterium]